MSIKYFKILIVLILFSVTSLNSEEVGSNYTLITKSNTFVAGDSVNLEFTYEGSTEIVLYCSNSYGSIILNPIIDQTLLFKIPEAISNKSGVLNWRLLSQTQSLSGQLEILPQSQIESLETYIGPPSIEAGGSDFTMLVTIPNDQLDNPLADSTNVSVKHQFLETFDRDEIYTKHGFGYKNLYSYRKSGRLIINTECLGLNSKEFDVNVVPAIPTNFTITADRVHNYADGNQITTFKTSIIKDRFSNTVSDGTFVTFIITNQLGHKSITSGTTIDGIATAQMLHPDHKEEWKIGAFIEGMADSEPINLNYEQAILDFDVQFSKDLRLVTIGPLKSFMNQYIPNGLNVTLKIYKDGIIENEIIEQSVEGFAYFKLNKDRYPKNQYDITIESAGITKSYNNLNYE